MTNPNYQVADAVRLVALRLEHLIECGKKTISAEDLLQALLSIADDLDPLSFAGRNGASFAARIEPRFG